MPCVALPDSSEAARRSNDVYARVMAANRQEAVDEVPPVVWASEPFLSGYAGVERTEYYETAEAKYLAQAKFQLDFPDVLHLPGAAPDYGYAPETSAWGSPIKQEDDGPLVPFAAVSDIHDLPALQAPDPWTAGYMAIALRDYAWYAEHMDPALAAHWGHFEGYGRCMGVESGALVLGYERYLIELYEHPQEIHDWNKRVVETNVAYVRAQEQITGPIQRLVVTDHLAGQVGQAHCEEFVYPYLKDIFDAFSSAEFRLYHNENLVPDAAVRAIADMNCTVFMFGIEMDTAARHLGGRVCLMGNVPPIHVVQELEPDQIVRDCQQRLAVGAPSGGMLLCTAGGLSPGTPAANIRAFANSVHGVPGSGPLPDHPPGDAAAR